MDSSKQTNSEVSGFFNEIADTYRSKYTDLDPFHDYFFNERLEAAVEGLEFKNKTILDIGAGTGNLFDRIEDIEPNPDYYACDIAGMMLEQSRIPAERRFEGACYDVEFPVKEFHHIFMLGVTTYLDKQELEKTLRFIVDSLTADGTAIITFTNDDSLDWKFRKIAKKIIRIVGSRKKVLSQDFQIFPLDQEDVGAAFGNMAEIVETKWLNHTVFPLNRLLKKTSISLAKMIHDRVKSETILNRFSSDFMVVIKRKD